MLTVNVHLAKGAFTETFWNNVRYVSGYKDKKKPTSMHYVVSWAIRKTHDARTSLSEVLFVRRLGTLFELPCFICRLEEMCPSLFTIGVDVEVFHESTHLAGLCTNAGFFLDGAQDNGIIEDPSNSWNAWVPSAFSRVRSRVGC